MSALFPRPPLLSPCRALCRSFFSLPNLSTGPQTYHEQVHLPYTQKELYNVVADVASYKHFIPFCVDSRVGPVSSDFKDIVHMQGELTVGFMAFTESYVSNVTCKPYEFVKAEAASSTPLFKALSTTWSFYPQTQTDTRVSLDLKYAFASPIHALVSAQFFGQVSRQMVEAFQQRCMDVYGKR